MTALLRNSVRLTALQNGLMDVGKTTDERAIPDETWRLEAIGAPRVRLWSKLYFSTCSYATGRTMNVRAHILIAVGISATAIGLAALIRAPVCADELLGPIALTATLYLIALGCDRGRPIFEGLAAAVAYTTSYSTLVLTLATVGAPLADHRLAACDEYFGLSVRGAIAWCAAHPTAQRFSDFVYYTAVPQTIITILALGYFDPRRLDAFLSRFMLAGIITAAGFVVFPAEGASAYYGLPTPDHYRPILDAIHSLRNGTYPITWRAAEGVIAFPSFHVTWGVLLIAAYRRHSWRLVFIPLNVLMIGSAVTSGMHYLVDVVAGFGVGMLAITIVGCRSEAEASWLRQVSTALAAGFGDDRDCETDLPIPSGLVPKPASNG
jgi:membrane-associated phospholipid phosphatase